MTINLDTEYVPVTIGDSTTHAAVKYVGWMILCGAEANGSTVVERPVTCEACRAKIREASASGKAGA